MLKNFLEKRDLHSLQQREKEIRRLQENPHFMRLVEEGILHDSSYYSSSSLVVCSQILKPVDHVHFEEYSTMEAFLANITDIEYQWFAQRCTDRTRTTMTDWEEGCFFNLKSAIHYLKFGDAIYSKMGHANPIRLEETLEMAQLQGNKKKIFNLLTSSQVVCPYCSLLEVESEIPQANKAPSSVDLSLVEIDKEKKEVISAIEAPVSGETLWPGSGSSGLPPSCSEPSPLEKEEDLPSPCSELSPLEKEEEKKPCILISAKIEPEYDLAISTRESDFDFQKGGLSDITNIIEVRKHVFEERVHIVEEKGLSKLRFLYRSGSPLQDQMVSVPFPVPTVSSIRWLTYTEKLPAMNLFLPALSGGTFYFQFSGSTLFWISGTRVRLKRNVEIIQRYCSCEKNKKKFPHYNICRKCGIRVKYKGLFISFFCTPHPEDSFVVRHPVSSAFLGCYTRKDTGEKGISFCGKKMGSDLAVVSFPDTWPYSSPLGFSPVNHLMSTSAIPSYVFEPHVPFFHVQTDTQILKKNFFPVEVIYLFQIVPENVLGHLIMTYLVWLEENFSLFDLYKMRGEKEKEAYGYSRINNQDYILLSKKRKGNEKYGNKNDFSGCNSDIPLFEKGPVSGSLVKSLWNG